MNALNSSTSSTDSITFWDVYYRALVDQEFLDEILTRVEIARRDGGSHDESKSLLAESLRELFEDYQMTEYNEFAEIIACQLLSNQTMIQGDDILAVSHQIMLSRAPGVPTSDLPSADQETPKQTNYRTAFYMMSSMSNCWTCS